MPQNRKRYSVSKRVLFYLYVAFLLIFPLQAIGGSLLRDYFLTPIADPILAGQRPDLEYLNAEKMGKVTEYFSPDFDFSVLSASASRGNGQNMTSYVAVGLWEHTNAGKPSRGWLLDDKHQLYDVKLEFELWISEHKNLSDITECIVHRNQELSQGSYFKAYEVRGDKLVVSIKVKNIDALSDSDPAVVTVFFASGMDAGCGTS